jgi:hypothetical protein
MTAHRTRDVPPTPETEALIDSRFASGRCRGAGEVARAALGSHRKDDRGQVAATRASAPPARMLAGGRHAG